VAQLLVGNAQHGLAGTQTEAHTAIRPDLQQKIGGGEAEPQEPVCRRQAALSLKLRSGPDGLKIRCEDARDRFCRRDFEDIFATEEAMHDRRSGRRRVCSCWTPATASC
jgi:hypothetical protein